jgi:hypothetical protein
MPHNEPKPDDALAAERQPRKRRRDVEIAPMSNKRRRRPNIATIIKQAEKAGKTVTGVSLDGVSLTFGQGQLQAPNAANDVNEWDAEYGGGKPEVH